MLRLLKRNPEFAVPIGVMVLAIGLSLFFLPVVDVVVASGVGVVVGFAILGVYSFFVD